MKKIKYILTFISLFILWGCNDTLDRFPKDKLIPEDFFKTERDLEYFSNTFYNIFPSESGIIRENVDNVTHYSLTSELLGSRLVPGDVGSGGWNWGYLREVNILLAYSHQCPDEKIRSKYNALAKFFRAYFYFEKVKRFGDVPWYDKPLLSNDPELKKTRDSRELIMQKILEDLDEAILNLPSKPSLYRITKWTALALKSRVCLFEGTFRKYHNIIVDGIDYKPYLEQAVKASNEFIELSSYTLYEGNPTTAYRDLFAAQNAIPDEIILARNFNDEYGVTHNSNFYTLGSSLGKPGLTKKIINSYLMKDGSRFTEKANFETMLFKNECLDRDPRLAQTIRTPGYTRLDENKKLSPDLAYTSTGYHPIKFVTETKYDSYGKSTNDLPLFRTAEVYLNLAEAKAELGNLTQEDLDKTIGKIRSRVGMPKLDLESSNANPDPYLLSPKTGYPNVKGNNQGVILEIRRERSIELIMENFRYYDMMRWKEGKTFEEEILGVYIPSLGDFDFDGDGIPDVCFYKGAKPTTKAPISLQVDEDIFLSESDHGYISPHKTMKRRWREDRDYLYPIPTDDILATDGALKQNPNWEDGLNFE